VRILLKEHKTHSQVKMSRDLSVVLAICPKGIHGLSIKAEYQPKHPTLILYL